MNKKRETDTTNTSSISLFFYRKYVDIIDGDKIPLADEYKLSQSDGIVSRTTSVNGLRISIQLRMAVRSD